MILSDRALLNRSLWFPYLICLGDSSLNDLNIFFTEEATSQQVVQDALEAPQPRHQQLSVQGEDVQASWRLLSDPYLLQNGHFCGITHDKEL